MYLPKEEVYSLLKELNGVDVFQAYPDCDFKKLPSITFQVTNNSVEVDLNNEILSQNIEVQVDIWGKNSAECSSVLDALEEKMRSAKYKMTYSADVPNIGKVKHVLNRFTTIK